MTKREILQETQNVLHDLTHVTIPMRNRHLFTESEMAIISDDFDETITRLVPVITRLQRGIREVL